MQLKDFPKKVIKKQHQTRSDINKTFEKKTKITKVV